MKILAMEIEKPGLTSEDFQPFLQAEAEKVWELYKKGIIREIYFRSDQSSAVLILECTDVEDAKNTLSTLPLVKAGLIEFSVIGLRPYPGWQRLFK